MNGAIDKQTSGNDWSAVLKRSMLHERLQKETQPPPSDPDQKTVIDDYEHQMSEHEQAFTDLLGKLQQSFVFSDTTEVESFLRMNRSIAPLLVEAAPHFHEYFKDSPLILDVMAEEGNPRTINVLAYWRGEREKAREALNAFDENWWMDNLRKASGKIVFDYELQK